MKAKELRELTSEELLQKERSLKGQMSALKYQRKIGRVEKPSQFQLIHRDIARILTILNERAKDGSKG
jgi:large subunit ribosomal protein L29